MSTAPRASRGGKRVLHSTTDATTASILGDGILDLNSFLTKSSDTSSPTNGNGTAANATNNNNSSNAANASASNNNNNNGGDLISSSAVGVVRGRARDNQTSIKERDPGAKQAEVESKLRGTFATIVNKSEKKSAAETAGDEESAITAEKVNANAVSLVAESHIFSTAMKILKADAKSRVIIVTSLEDVAASASINNFQQKEGEQKITVGSFCGAEKQIPTSAASLADARLWYTTYRAMISFLNVFVRDSALVCPFTHILLVAKDGKCSPLFDATLSIISSLIFASTPSSNSGKKQDEEEAAAESKKKDSGLPQPKSKKQKAAAVATVAFSKKAFGENVKIVLGGVSSVEDVKNSISAADKSVTLSVGSLVQTELKHTPVAFTPFEAAALAGTMVKEHAPSAVSLRRLPGAVSSLPASLIDHGVSVATTVVAKAVQFASSEKLSGLRVAIIGAELNELQTSINTALPATSFALFTEVRDFVAAAASADNKGKVLILLLSRALTSSAAAQLKLHLVVDSGTERRAMIPPQSEMQFPIKVVLAPTKREAQARKTMAGFCEDGPGVFIAAADFSGTSNNASSSSSSPARGVESSATTTTAAEENGSSQQQQQQTIIDDEEDLLDPVCDAVLALAQNSLELAHLVRDVRKGREAQLALALTFLTDLGFIARGARADMVVTTFLGEICARSGLPADFSCIVINGLAVGMSDAAVYVATAAARPFRAATIGSPASSSNVNENEFGDTIEDAITLAEGAAAEDVKKFLAARKQGSYPIHTESFESAIRVVKIVQKGIEDFVIPRSHASASSAAAVAKQIGDNVNLLVAFVAAALARRAVVVRHEGDDRINTISRGNLLFTHTAKEVLPNRFLHSGAAWKKDNVMVCSSIQNTPTRLLGSGCTGVSNDYFMGCLFSLSPFISYEAQHQNQNQQQQQQAPQFLFSVALNNLEKTSLVPQRVADQLLKLRDSWKTLMSYVQLRRATGAKTTTQFKELAAKHLDKRFNLENAQAEYVADLCELISDFHVNVPLGSAHIGRDPSRIRSHILAAPIPPSTLSGIAMPSDFAVAKEVARMAVPASSGAADDDEDEVVGSTANAAATAVVTSNAAAVEEASDDEDEEADVIIDDE